MSNFWCFVPFQLTSSRWGWRIFVFKWNEEQIFQLTSSRGGWPGSFIFSLIHLHFNSHPHEEDDRWGVRQLFTYYISTHILTRRMTCTVYRNESIKFISTHILTRRMTPFLRIDGRTSSFQLTSSRGGWLSSTHWMRIIRCISTHILTRRMTYHQKWAHLPYPFQLTSSRGGWRRETRKL